MRGRKLLHNTALLFGGDQIANVLQFVLLFWVARSYGEAQMGLYNEALALAGLFVLLADFGVAEFTIREVARGTDPTRALVARALVIRAAGLAGALLLALACVPLIQIDRPRETTVMLATLGLYLGCVSLGDVFLAEMKGLQRMGRVAATGVMARGVILAAGVGLILSGASFTTIFTAFPLAGLAYLGLAAGLSIRELGPPPFRLVRRSDLRSMGAALVPFAAAILFNEAISRQDVILLGRLWQPGALEEIGVYWAGLKIATLFLGVSGFFQHAIYPMLSEMHVTAPEAMSRTCHQVTRYLLIGAFPISAGLYAIAPRLIPFLFKDRFAGSVPCLEIMSWVVVIGLTHSVFSALLSATGRQYQKSISLAINLALALTLNALLIPFLGAVGASVTRVSVEIAPLVMYGWLAHRAVPGWNPIPDAIRPGVASIVMIAAVRAVGAWPLPLAIATGAAVYAATLLLIGGLPREDRIRLAAALPARIARRVSPADGPRG